MKSINKTLSIFNNNIKALKSFSVNAGKLEVPKYSFTTEMNFQVTSEKFPIFRVTNEKGEVLNKDYDNLDKETALKIFDTMLKVNVFDEHYNSAQRLNIISFYMTAKGEEAITPASCAALELHDSIYPQYREQGALLFRGFSNLEMTNQLTGNYLDNGKGRQMPVHYGSKKLNYQTVSSPLATQIPQAAGAGYLFKSKNQDRVCITYFGEGAASEGDFHAGMNFAATLNAQTIFFCRNNKYAISTSFQDQYKGDGIASRGAGYGMTTIRIDGNDVLAVYNAVKEARKISTTNKKPILIEAMSFRGGDHSTSDFSANYRTKPIMEGWEDYIKSLGNPIERFENYLLNKQWIDKEYVKISMKDLKQQAKESLKKSTSYKKSSVNSMFEDTYDHVTKDLQEQKENLHAHLEKYGSHYELDNYHNDKV